MSRDALRVELAETLLANGIGPAATHEFHDWRCKYPVEYPGHCGCVEALLDDLLAAVERAK